MRIAIVGGGWFGCHIGLELLKLGAEIDLFEAQPDLFAGASGYNQNRLHLGFHYPRSHITREQSKAGYREFVAHYPTLSSEIKDNVYAVGKDRSLLDFETYVAIMKSAELEFELREPGEFGLRNTAGSVTCRERLIETSLAREFFRKSALAKHLHLGSPVREVHAGPKQINVDGKDYDLLVNCTWQQFLTYTEWQFYFEACVVLLYEGPAGHAAITVMDGPFFTIYPFEKNLYTLYSVTQSTRRRASTRAEAQFYLDEVRAETIERMRRDFEDEVRVQYTGFFEKFKFAGIHRSIRTRYKDASDARPCLVAEEDRLVQVLSGKIDHIFHAADRVQECLKKYS